MVALLACWVAFPLILVLLAQGAGTIVALLCGRQLPSGIRLPCGVALVIALMDLCTRTTATAPLAVPVAVGVGVVGLALSRPWRWRRPGWANPATALGAFAAYAAPIVMSGEATWAGYIKLDDTATWLALVDRALQYGRSITGLAPSTYQDALSNYLTVGYPLGSFLPIGLGHALLGQDIAWLTDPWMAFMAAMLALALAHIARRALPNSPSWQPAAIGVLAAQSTLLYGYYLWGGMKEMAGALLIGAFAGALPLALTGKGRLRALIPALVVAWALIAALSSGGLIWVGPGGVLAAVLLLARAGVIARLRERVRSAGRVDALVLTTALAVLAIGAYLVLRPGGFYQRYKSVLTSGTQLGNLLNPLHLTQIAGIWPSQDFRYTPSELTITNVLISLVIICAVGGMSVAVWRTRVEMVLYVLCAVVAAFIVFEVASPWLGGKALASASPALPLAALVGAAMLAARGERLIGAIIAAVIGAGILWSNGLGYHGVSLAPRQQFAELAHIGELISGQGPTLMTEYQPYGARHFLRDAAPESASELRTRLDLLISGQQLPKGGDADIDDFQLSAVMAYRTLVLQTSPVVGRPSSNYKLIFHDKFWDVWQRGQQASTTILTLSPLGDSIAPGAVPSCASVKAIAQHPGATSLIAAPVVNPVVVATAASTHPANWNSGASYLSLSGSGSASIPVTVPTAGRYLVWLGGSMRGPISISVDGVSVGHVRNEIQEGGQYVPFGDVTLTAGAHTVTLRYGGDILLPGSGGPADLVGPLVLSQVAPALPLITVPISDAKALCGRNLSWIEAVGS